MSNETADPTPADAEKVTDTTSTTEVPEEPQSDEREPDAPTDDAPSGPAAQAAKYRVRLREAEAERDALAERLNTLQAPRS